MTEPNYVIKICLLGEASVGKTSLVYRYIENKFKDNYKSTLGVNLLKKDLNLEGYGDVAATIWDLGGQDSFKSLRKLYLEGANGALIIFDLTQKDSFLKLDNWIQTFQSERPNEPIVIIGNKDDLEKKKVVTEKEALDLAERYSSEFISTSAKTGSNVEQAFNKITRTILDNQLEK